MVTFEDLSARKEKIAVVGLGYVGLPLAVHLSRFFDVIGYDLNAGRIEELQSHFDHTLEVTEKELKQAQITYTSDDGLLAQCKLIIIAVPTPIDAYRIPDLNPLRSASSAVGRNLMDGSCVVYESTVYPGATEEVCLPILSQESGLAYGRQFTVGYSPERINPGDKVHTVDKIVKVVSGSDKTTQELLANVYGKIVPAGIHIASSIKVAEAAKVIENTQRDLNIALMNELSMIFDRLNIDTLEVLEAAGTKWNFLPFRPGLVGGHCIGVDPYYLTHKAEAIGYHPEMILAGRRINDGMGKYIAEKTVKMLISAGKPVRKATIAVLGITFKENVPDLRNTRVVDIITELQDYGVQVIACDPLADKHEASRYYDIRLQSLDTVNGVDGVILAVIHKAYADMGLGGIASLCSKHHPIIVDVKGAFTDSRARKLGVTYWRL